MPQKANHKSAVSQAELLGAALRYCAVADWFEACPCTWHRHMTVSEALDRFNRAESELRQLGARVMRGGGHRALVLQAVGIDEEAR